MTSAASPEKTEIVFVRHMGRSPTTRTKRAARAGHRRQGVVLCNGLRIRKKNRLRPTKVALKLLAQDWKYVLELVRVGTLEICDTDGKTVPFERLQAFLTGGAPPPQQPVPAPAATQPSPPAEPKGYTEEELEKKTRNELNEIAKEFGVASPHKLPSKPAVIEAIFAASTDGGE
ncbi:MAG: hypothetical protein HKO76_08965 [Acidimicrobiia bacterium]|nr:hypothetical protein [Acidimicrobiia bacterium]